MFLLLLMYRILQFHTLLCFPLWHTFLPLIRSRLFTPNFADSYELRSSQPEQKQNKKKKQGRKEESKVLPAYKSWVEKENKQSRTATGSPNP